MRFCLYFSVHCYPDGREVWQMCADGVLPRVAISRRSACSGLVEAKARGWEQGQVQALPVVYMKVGSGESPSSRNSPEQCHCSSPPSKTLTHVSGSRSYAKLGYLMPGAMPRARGEKVTAGVSLPQPRSRKAATPKRSHGSQCDEFQHFPKAGCCPQDEKDQGNAAVLMLQALCLCPPCSAPFIAPTVQGWVGGSRLCFTSQIQQRRS